VELDETLVLPTSTESGKTPVTVGTPYEIYNEDGVSISKMKGRLKQTDGTIYEVVSPLEGSNKAVATALEFVPIKSKMVDLVEDEEFGEKVLTFWEEHG
jgi:hypothetical protein